MRRVACPKMCLVHVMGRKGSDGLAVLPQPIFQPVNFSSAELHNSMIYW